MATGESRSLGRIYWTRAALRAALAAIPLLFLVPLALGWNTSKPVDRLEKALYDWRVRLTTPGGADPRIVIVAIDEKSLAAEGQWPWSREKLASLVNQLFHRYGARVVGFDALFPERDNESVLELIRDLEPLAGQSPALRQQLAAAQDQYQSDHRFAGSLMARDVVLGYSFQTATASDPHPNIGALPQPLPIDEGEIKAGAWIEAQSFIGVLPELQSQAATSGFIDLPTIDSDGVIRLAPLLQRYHEQLYESFALAVAREALARPPVKLVFSNTAPNARHLKQIQLGELKIPVDASGSVWIPFRGRVKTFPYESATTVINGQANGSALKDAIVLVGTTATAPGDVLQTAMPGHFFGVEVHANLVAGLLNQSILSEPSWARTFEVLLLVGLALLVTFVLPRLTPVAQGVGVVALGSFLVAMNFWAWARGAMVLPLAVPLVGLLATSALVLSYCYFIEDRRRRRLSRTFSRYVSMEIVRELDATNAEVSLEGESREMSVLFSDVRGFTTLSEGLSPRELTRLMNELLTPLTDVIQQKRGTIDKYMGDAIMAFWGAPLPDARHAARAVEAALLMTETTKRIAADFASRGWPDVHIGIGISSGLMNVGNMGSEYRMAYTVLGDTVNLGSRLESLTKQYGVDIIVSGATAKLCPEFAFRELDLVKVKGKNEPVAIYEPLGPLSAMPPAHVTRLHRFSEMLQLYRSRRFSGAQELLGTLAAEREEPLIALYKQRIAHFEVEPPPGSWDGVFVHLSK